ncbi:MAG: ribonuclease D [Pirellulales bacterium]
MSHTLIKTDAELAAFCGRMAQASRIAFDTEFVSEHTYRPLLCLVQVAVGEEEAVIDPLAGLEMQPFWELIVEPGREIVVHAGREEMAFCLEAVGRMPENLFDVQLAAGLIGMEYPAGYGNLISRVLNKKTHKAETRTDWRRRPLCDKQVAYAVDDVRYLFPIRDKIGERLAELGRLEWLKDEGLAWQQSVNHSLGPERWRRVSGSSTLASRGLAIIRELWKWRDEEARRRNRPSRQTLRDDLIVELAKRRSDDPKQIAAVRGFERGDLKRAIPDLAKAIKAALELPDAECPRTIRREPNSHLAMIGQFLSSALSSICRQQEVAPSLVGTVDDVRELVAYRMGGSRSRSELPELMRGWRAQVVGQVLDDLLAGRVAIRIQDPESDHPLAIEPVTQQA